MEIKKGEKYLYYGETDTRDRNPRFVKGGIYEAVADGVLINQSGDKNKITDVFAREYFRQISDIELEDREALNRSLPLKPYKSKNDPVNHPPHYTQGKVESIDAIESALGEEGFKGFLAGNAMKYIHRYRHKNGVEDLKKANWYLNRLIKTLETDEETT